jgi:hypothetical protein
MKLSALINADLPLLFGPTNIWNERKGVETERRHR